MSEFTSSDPSSIGIELELQLLSPDTYDLVDGIIPLMDFFPNAIHVKPEFIQNTVEITTDICHTADELFDDLSTVARNVLGRCDYLGMAICGSGTHPFSKRLALITPQPKYLKMEKTSGVQSHIQITFATHVHVGMESGQQAIMVMDRLKAYIPLLIAISGNSPYWRGLETGYTSYRHIILAAARSYGIPPTFGSWERFIEFADLSRRAGVFKAINDIHWDIRPRPALGSVEIRCLDAQSSVSDAIAIAAFVRGLVELLRMPQPAQIEDQRLRPLPWWLEKENHFQASRKGLGATYIHNEQGDSRSLREVWQQVVERVLPVAEELGDGKWVRQLQDRIADAPAYERQRRCYEEQQSFSGLMTALTNNFRSDLATNQTAQPLHL